MRKTDVGHFCSGKRSPAADGVGSVLSPLEHDVLCALWDNGGEFTVRKLHSMLKGKKVALTSVAVILDRLHDKGFVSRRQEAGRGGIHYIYSANGSKLEMERNIVDSAVNNLLRAFGPVAVNYFDEKFGKAHGA